MMLNLVLFVSAFAPIFSTQYVPHGFGCLDSTTQQLPFCNLSLPISARVLSLVNTLTLSEKVGLSGSFLADKICSDVDAGVPRLNLPNVSQLIELTGTVSSSCYFDEEGGAYCPTVFPSPLSLAATFDASLWRLKGTVTGVETRAFNNLHVPRIYFAENFVDLLGFGPDLNLIVDPRNGRNGENPTEDPTLAGAYAEEVVRGIQEGEDPNYMLVATGLKHAAVYQYETNRMASNNNVSLFDLFDTYLPPFARGFQKGQAAGAMCAYDSINGIPACANPWFLASIIREYWNRSDAVITSDCTAIENEYTAKGWTNSYANATALSILSGTDACIGTAFIAEGGIVDALEENLMPLDALDATLLRSLTTRFKLGMFDPPNATIYTTYGPERINTPDSAMAAELAAAQGAVLLSNTGGVLPINVSSPAIRSIAVIGPHAVSQRDLLGDFYGDAFCPGVSVPGNVDASCVPTLGASVANFVAQPRPDVSVTVVQGVGILSDNAEGIPAAVNAANEADVIFLCVGYSNAEIEHEGADHAGNTLPGLQSNLTNLIIAAAAARQVPVIMILVNAGQIALDNLAALPPVIIEAFYPAFGSPSLVRQLFGELNHWGRLPYTIYGSEFIEEANVTNVAVSTGIGRTYRYYTGIPNFRFGAGLSYASFDNVCASPSAPNSFPASSQFTVNVSCATSLAASSKAVNGDEILLAFHRVGNDVRRLINGSHPIPFSTLRHFARVSNVTTQQGGPFTTPFAFQPLDLSLIDGNGASALYPGTHYVDVSPREPGGNQTFTITITGQTVLLTAPPLPPST